MKILFKQLECKANNNEEYKFEDIHDSAVYRKKFKTNYFLRLYYLVLWKSYFKEKNTGELASTI